MKVKTADGSFLDLIMLCNHRPRMEIKKGLIEYLVDKIAWFRAGSKFRKMWVDAGYLPPDWYRPETDAEFRNRINEEIKICL